MLHFNALNMGAKRVNFDDNNAAITSSPAVKVLDAIDRPGNVFHHNSLTCNRIDLIIKRKIRCTLKGG